VATGGHADFSKDMFPMAESSTGEERQSRSDRAANRTRSRVATVTIPMFSALIRSLWFLLAAFTLALELIPLSRSFEERFSSFIFYSYVVAKLVGFFIFGFLTPIAWWSYKTFGVGALFVLFTTAIVELAQSFLTGHRFSIIELTVKCVLVFGGFVAGLDVRKYQELRAGPLYVRFSSCHW
jgi:hypothetical protein